MTVSINIITYNTHLFFNSIAATFKKDLVYKDAERFADIQERLEDPANAFDIIGLTEVWAHSSQSIVKSNLQSIGSSFAFQGEPVYNGGNGMVLTVRGTFNRPVGFQYYEKMTGADQLASKGVTYARAVVKGVQVLIVQTHTQASYVGSETKDDAARDQQIKETLLSILDAHASFQGPVFVLGDLNIPAGTPEYQWFCNEMSKRGLEDSWTEQANPGPGITYDPANDSLVKHFDPKQTKPYRLDYIFSNRNRSKLKSIHVPTDWKTADLVDLSDHYPLLATFEL